jgi:RNA polymerase sigma-70 factor (ECF subfamily)
MEGLAVREDFEELVALHRPRIYRFALASLRDRDAADSVAQDCFLRAHRAWPQFRGDSSVQTWLMKIAVNLIRDAARVRRIHFWRHAEASAILLDTEGQFIADLGSSAEERLSARQQVEAVWRALDDLSPNQRKVFLLHFMEDMGPGEIEEVTGMTNGAIRVQLHRAIQKVRQTLNRQTLRGSK